MHRYRFSFDWKALVFTIVMLLPTAVWACLAGADDPLRAESLTRMVDIVGLIAQSLMIASIIFIRSNNEPAFNTKPALWAAILCALTYFGLWGRYAMGHQGHYVILGLAVAPCLAFAGYCIFRRNHIALVLCSIFAMCHLYYAVYNFWPIEA